MEIVEGLKGPSFTISSTDGNLCSGGTPDIVWESFQKKGCAKLWHGKMFSCKIDGVEELLANVGETTEQSSLTKFKGEARETTCQWQSKPSDPDPDSLTNLVKSSHAKGKRSRNNKVVSSKRHNSNHYEQHEQEESTKNVTSSTCKQRDLSNGRNNALPTFAAANEVSTDYYNPGAKNLVFVIEKEKCLPTAEKSLQLDSMETADNLKAGEVLSKEEQYLESLDVDNLQPKQEPVEVALGT